MDPKRTYITPDIYYFDKSILGQGSFGKVFKGVDMRNGFTPIAVKKVFINGCERQLLFHRQVSALEGINHKNIVRFHGCFDNEHVKGEKFIIMEYCPGGTLNEEIRAKGKLPENVCLEYFKQIVDGMVSVNSDSFIHRDLKPANIVLTDCRMLKICDFGIARQVKDGTELISSMTLDVGTSIYMAPQVSLKTEDSEGYSSKCDVWSAGVILHQMLTGKNPFRLSTVDLPSKLKQIKQNKNLVLEGEYSELCKKLVQLTVVYDQHQRKSFKDIKQFMDEECERVQKRLKFTTVIASLREITVEEDAVILQEDVGKKKEVELEELGELKLHHQLSIRQARLELSEKSRIRVDKIIKYIEFLFERSQLFLIFSNYLNKSSDTLEKSEILVILGLSIGVFLSTISQLTQLLNSDPIHLPDQTIHISDLDQKSYQKFTLKRKQYLTKIFQQKKQVYFNTTDALRQKFTNEKYTINRSRAVFQFRHLKDQIISASNSRKLSFNRQWFQRWFRKFFCEYECQKLYNIEKQTPDFLRIHWGCLELARVDQNFPIEKYGDSSVFDRFHDKFEKTPVGRIKEELIIRRSMIIK